MTSRSVVVRRRLITGYGTELRQLLRVPATLDRDHALELAASLEEMSQHLRYDVRRYSRYLSSAAFRAQAYQRSDDFYVQARDLHTQLQQGASLEQIQLSCDGMVTSWEAFSKTISSMPAAGLAQTRYQVMEDARQELLPVMAEVVTILGN